jgi:hypothetical protein
LSKRCSKWTDTTWKKDKSEKWAEGKLTHMTLDENCSNWQHLFQMEMKDYPYRICSRVNAFTSGNPICDILPSSSGFRIHMGHTAD